MEFRLLYSGRLLGSGGTNSRAPEKHAMRREFHPQLKRLWYTNSALSGMADWLYTGWFQKHSEPMIPFDRLKAREIGIRQVSEQWQRCGYHFVPLVTEKLCIRCSLDILFLRPEEGGKILQGGDIDGRIKTIFDALRLPKNLDEVAKESPRDDEDPFFCLLEDDSLISEIRVTTDQLLLLPKEREVKASDAHLVIHVRLKATNRAGEEWIGV